jgi:hypothetical protein
LNDRLEVIGVQIAKISFSIFGVKKTRARANFARFRGYRGYHPGSWRHVLST